LRIALRDLLTMRSALRQREPKPREITWPSVGALLAISRRSKRKAPMTRSIIIVLLLAAPACSGTAYIVQGDARGGEVALEGAYIDSIAEARAVMAEHCHGRFTVRDANGARVDVPTRGQSHAKFDCRTRRASDQLASAR
jgi:hypothetical protein